MLLLGNGCLQSERVWMIVLADKLCFSIGKFSVYHTLWRMTASSCFWEKCFDCYDYWFFFCGFADVKKYNFLLCSLFLHMILIAEQSSPFWDTEANDRCMLLCYRLWTGLRMLCMTCTWLPACRNQCGLAWCHLAATVMHFVISLFTSSWHWPPSMTTNLTNCKWLDLLYR